MSENKEPEKNEWGNIVERPIARGEDRYAYDFEFCKSGDGWVQYDTSQDAWYFGIWVNPEKREIVTYAEGDESIVKCPTEESYHAELKSMAEFYGDPPPAFKVISLKEKTVTEVYGKRPE